MATIVRPHAYPDGAAARPDHANDNENVLYNEINGNLDFENLKAALQNAANGLVKLDGDAKVPLAQLPTTIPSGVIVMWSGTLGTIPAGWSLCDGTGETPDLRDKFIYGWSDGVDPGGTGGAATHIHTYSDLPAHSHSHSHGISPNPHTHDFILSSSSTIGPVIFGLNRLANWTHTTQGTSLTIDADATATGVAAPETDEGSTLPPYYKLAFIQKD